MHPQKELIQTYREKIIIIIKIERVEKYICLNSNVHVLCMCMCKYDYLMVTVTMYILTKEKLIIQLSDSKSL